MKKSLEQPRTIDLVRHDGRFYTIYVGPTLLHENAIQIVRGGLRMRGVRRDEAFVTREQLATRWRALVAARRRHGYVERGAGAGRLNVRSCM